MFQYTSLCFDTKRAPGTLIEHVWVRRFQTDQQAYRTKAFLLRKRYPEHKPAEYFFRLMNKNNRLVYLSFANDATDGDTDDAIDDETPTVLSVCWLKLPDKSLWMFAILNLNLQLSNSHNWSKSSATSRNCMS